MTASPLTWADLITSTVPKAAVDPVADPTTVQIPADMWHPTAAHLKASGAHVWEWLSAADLPDGLTMAMHVRSGTAGDAGVILTARVTDDAPLASVADIWPGASWHERETAEMFGVTFGSGITAPLLLADHDVPVPPLRRATALQRRVETPWPGRHESGESDAGARTRRRPILPPGVRPEWLPQ